MYEKERNRRYMANLSNRTYIYHAARFAFFVVAASIATSALLLALGSVGETGCRGSVMVEFVPGVDVACAGFPYATGIERALEVFVNLIPASVLSVLLFIGSLYSVLFSGYAVSLSDVGRLLLLLVVTGVLLGTTGLALLYFLYLVVRLRSSETYKKIAGLK